MISYIEGKILEIDDASLTIFTHGVGYEVLASSNTLSCVKTGEQTHLFIHTHVKEDLLQLFGFANRLEKKLFLSLIKVNGVGPKMATQILSGASIDTICNWIEAGDAKGLTTLPKVGKKTAEQIILSLKGKLVMVDAASPAANDKKEVVSALVNLGFKLSDVEIVVKNLEEGLDVEEGIRQSLRTLTSL